MSKLKIFAVAILMLFLAAGVFAATPEGPLNFTIINSTRRAVVNASSVNACAGNVTELYIFGETVTQTWQGYVGNVSGVLSLDDASNYTLYDWQDASPRGEVYASTGAVDFSLENVACYNYSENAGAYLNLTELEDGLGLSPSSVDGVNETFTPSQNYTGFYAGLNYINGSCPLVNLYNSSGNPQDRVFIELLLYDATANKPVYTALIQAGDVSGFNARDWDFEMIVGENGHAADQNPSVYYFYIELE